jgi:multiple sugar transport system ATP-binding protein
MTMGDRVAVMRDGVLQQCASPRELYERPANVFVAGFIGSPAMNLRDFRVDNGNADIAGATVPISRAAARALEAEESLTATLGFRPESLERVGPDNGFAVTVSLVEELGSDAYCYGTLDGCDRALGDVDVIARLNPRDLPRKGDRIHLRIRPGETHVFSARTGARLDD